MVYISLFGSPWAGKSDELLAQATKRGEASAFEAMYEKYHKPIYNYLRNLLNYNQDDTVSVTSDVFIKLYEYLKKNEVNNLKSMLYRMAHNAAIDRIRTNQTQREQIYDDALLDIHQDSDIEKQEFHRECTQHLFQELLNTLDTQQREVIYLYYQEEKSYDEIAEILGSNKNTIGTILFNAKKKLNALAMQQGIKDVLLE